MTSKFTYRNNKAAKVTAPLVIEMRARWARGNVTQAQLCREYGLSVVQMGRILRGESWQNVAMPLGEEDMAASAQRMLAVQAERDNAPPPAFVSLTEKLANDVVKQRAKEFLGDDLLAELRVEAGKKPPVNPLDEE